MKKVAAVICEYNPFHNGHKFLLERQREELGAYGVICIMSGSFTQRGEPAVLNKWLRAEMAVKGGADLVFELPAVFCTQSAERFARGGVSLADRLGVVNSLFFGSECGNINLLNETADFLSEQSADAELLKHYSGGVSYPAARQKMLESIKKSEICEIIKSPNNILALEYIMALKKRNSKILPVTFKRQGAEHDGEETEGGFASASKIRSMLKNGESISRFVPKTTSEILKSVNDELVYDISPLSDILTYILRTKPKEELKNILDMSEGLENRFVDAAMRFGKISEISDFVKTKRYTKSRINRIITNIVLNITKDMDFEECEYARVLAFNDRGAELLKMIKQASSLNIITKTADASLLGGAKKMLEKDILATDVYALLTKNKQAGKDYRTSPVYVKSAGII